MRPMVGKRCNEENYLPTSRFQLLIFVTRQEQTLERTTTKEIKAITLGGGGRVWRFERGRRPKPKMKERSSSIGRDELWCTLDETNVSHPFCIANKNHKPQINLIRIRKKI